MMTLTGRTVLLVDDNDDNRIILSTILSHEGCTVLEATDGSEGVESARRDRPDAIIMDISLPRMDGYEATRLLKADEDTAEIPIIALTANAQETDRQRALAAGANAYIAKPAEPRYVVMRIRELLDGAAAPS